MISQIKAIRAVLPTLNDHFPPSRYSDLLVVARNVTRFGATNVIAMLTVALLYIIAVQHAASICRMIFFHNWTYRPTTRQAV